MSARRLLRAGTRQTTAARCSRRARRVAAVAGHPAGPLASADARVVALGRVRRDERRREDRPRGDGGPEG
jgi:hypothetical protein